MDGKKWTMTVADPCDLGDLKKKPANTNMSSCNIFCITHTDRSSVHISHVYINYPGYMYHQIVRSSYSYINNKVV